MIEDEASRLPTLDALGASRDAFLRAVERLRPDLHRYCARMTGSVTDGEDVVQETLAIAYFKLPELDETPPLRPWLFRIAHNRAIDQYRRATHRAVEPLDDAPDAAADEADEPERAIESGEAVSAAVSAFLSLPSSQRACVVLADVLEYSLDEIGASLDLSVSAVKAALHRGRRRLRSRADREAGLSERVQISPALQRYVALFNAHDWEGIRDLLADDVRLDLVSRRQAAGAAIVGTYFGNYETAGPWRLVAGRLGRDEAIGVYRGDAAEAGYFIELTWHDEKVATIRDFRHVPYIGRDADFLSAA